MERNIIIGVFCYNRADKLKKCINALLKNPECKTLDIVFFSDGYKGPKDQPSVMETREYINSITGFKSVIKHFRETNFSTGPNFRTGLTFLSENYDEFIIVEDDLVVSANYIKFLMDALTFYKSKKGVFCVTAFVPPITAPWYSYDSIVYKRFCSYGWAGWSDRFENIMWENKDLERLITESPGFSKRLNAEGYDLMRMLRSQISGKISTWDIQMQVHVAQNRLKVIYPVISKVNNIGFDEESTNTFGVDFLKTPIDSGTNRTFKFCDDDMIVPELQVQIKAPFSLKKLVVRKITNEFIKLSRRIKSAT